MHLQKMFGMICRTSIGLVITGMLLSTSAEAKKKKDNYDPLPGSIPLSDHFNQDAAHELVAKGIKEIVFVKRKTFDADHMYTEYVNSTWKPEGNLCVLNLETGAVRELIPELTGGVFNRFDVSFDAKKVLFDYKKDKWEGYRIYEVNLDGSGLRQITFPAKNEKELVKKYKNWKYHHGTDDLHPCYLPDGGIAFVSTRCNYSTLCNAGDWFTTKVLYRMDYDGSNMRPLSNNSVSEACPVVLPDGRIIYHRWEYNDKASANAKCLWSIRPDGTGSAEVYGNTLTQPESLIYARPVPNAPNKIVTLASSHWRNNAIGTVLLIDTSKNIRTREPITYITKDVDARTHDGFHFYNNGKWKFNRDGKPGRLFKDPYPISEDLFIVSHKPKGYLWKDPNAYDLYLLNGKGETTALYKDKEISCWHPYPVIPRVKPAVSQAPIKSELAEREMAECIVTDVYVGMPNVKRGTVKYLRIMEQVPRPWAARNRWGGDRVKLAHTVIGIGRLGLKVQYGIVPVEEDGSVYFEVPANRNIYFQALDKNYMAVQTERTYVNYAPGETRSCIGCHETPDMVPVTAQRTTPLALKRTASKPQPQPGDTEAEKVIDYMAQVQPVWDKHCISCHGTDNPKKGLNLTGEMLEHYTVSYVSLMKYNKKLKTSYMGEWESASEGRANYDISYRNAYTSGSHTSPIVTILSHGRIPLRNNPKADEITKRLMKAHEKVNVSKAEFVNVVNWIDSFGQFYPSYWGLKNKGYQKQNFFRPLVTHAEAISREVPERFEKLYTNPPKSIKYKRKSKEEKEWWEGW